MSELILTPGETTLAQLETVWREGLAVRLAALEQEFRGLSDDLAARHFLRQAYLDAPGLRIRSMEADGKTRHLFTYKRTIEDQVVEIEIPPKNALTNQGNLFT